jgi:Zn-dependent protease
MSAGLPPSASARPAASSPARRRRSLSFPIGRVAGIQVRVHVTFLILIPLFAVAGAQPGGPGEFGAIAWLFVIFACVLVHEFAHCLVGRPRGIVVHEIELLPIGGVSKLENLPDDPHDELAVAIAGPLASLAIAAVAASLAALLGQPLLPIDLFDGDLLARIAWFNLIIAAFNLLPAFPLDGGRVFRAALEERGLSLERATSVAARTGRAVALALVAVGILFDVWLALIGLFVYFGASAEESATFVHARFRGHVVGDLMLLEPVVVDATMSVAEFRTLSRRSAQRAFPVVGAAGYEGMVQTGAGGAVDPATPLAGFEDHSAPVVAPTDELEQCLTAVATSPARAAAVLDGAEVVGVLRVEELQHLLADPLPLDAGTGDHGAGGDR